MRAHLFVFEKMLPLPTFSLKLVTSLFLRDRKNECAALWRKGTIKLFCSQSQVETSRSPNMFFHMASTLITFFRAGLPLLLPPLPGLLRLRLPNLHQDEDVVSASAGVLKKCNGADKKKLHLFPRRRRFY